MIVLIDGYNILRFIYPSARIEQKQRDRFLNLLATYAALKKHTIYVIFDGGPDTRPSTEYFKDIIVVYSGVHESADDIIKKYIEEKKGEKALITSDRALRQWSEKRGVVTFVSDAFYDFLNAALQEKPIVMKTKSSASKYHDVDQEIDQLMEDATQQILFKREDLMRQEREPLQKSSKQEKKITKVIKKL